MPKFMRGDQVVWTIDDRWEGTGVDPHTVGVLLGYLGIGTSD